MLIGVRRFPTKKKRIVKIRSSVLEISLDTYIHKYAITQIHKYYLVGILYFTRNMSSKCSEGGESMKKACLIVSQLPVHHFGDLKLVWLVVLTLNRYPKQCIKTHHQKHAESLVREGEDMR